MALLPPLHLREHPHGDLVIITNTMALVNIFVAFLASIAALVAAAVISKLSYKLLNRSYRRRGQYRDLFR